MHAGGVVHSGFKCEGDCGEVVEPAKLFRMVAPVQVKYWLRLQAFGTESVTDL